VTIAAGTFPSWAASGRLKLDGGYYEVEQRTSTTTLTLTADANPGADVAAGAAYILYRSGYALPNDFRQIVRLHDSTSWWWNSYISPDAWMSQERWYRRTAGPFFWTVLPDSENKGRFKVQMAGSPAAASQFAFIYHSAGTDPVRSGAETSSSVGTITTNGTVDVVGASTTFATGPSMVGAYLTVGDTSDAPTNEDGLFPFAERVEIRSVTDATNLVLVEAATTSTALLKYVVSDPLYMSSDMANALFRGAEHQLAILTADAKRIGQAHGEYRRALTLAMESDDRVAYPISALGSASPYYLANARNISFGTTFDASA
jgi:hypothetical protein